MAKIRRPKRIKSLKQIAEETHREDLQDASKLPEGMMAQTWIRTNLLPALENLSQELDDARYAKDILEHQLATKDKIEEAKFRENEIKKQIMLIMKIARQATNTEERNV